MGTVRKFRILAFDPGIGNTGWSLLEGNTRDKRLTILKIGELHPGPTADRAANKEQVERFDKRTISLSLLSEFMTNLINETKPDFVCCEDIYISMAHPTAITSLAMWVGTAKLTAFRCGLRLTVIPTKICKKAITGSGANGKISVQNAVVSNPNISFKHEDDIRQMTEHEADSIAVGVALNENHRDYILAYLGQM